MKKLSSECVKSVNGFIRVDILIRRKEKIFRRRGKLTTIDLGTAKLSYKRRSREYLLGNTE